MTSLTMMIMTSSRWRHIARLQRVAMCVQCGHLSSDDSAASSIVRSELDRVPGTSRQIRDDDVLLLRPSNFYYNILINTTLPLPPSYLVC